MPDPQPAEPVNHHGVMVSSTYVDLEPHRESLIDILIAQRFFPECMEHRVNGPDEEVISASLAMVQSARAYICLISHRCGQCPVCATRNRDGHSVTRLEFDKAQTLNRPTIVFVMSRRHPVLPDHVETDAKRKQKLDEFREHAKSGRIYVEFDSLDDFKVKAALHVAELRRFIEEQDEAATTGDHATSSSEAAPTPPVPKPPAFHAVPSYLGSHQFVGRASELESIDDWADAHDPHPVLLFEAMGGQGKSMLTWHWAQGTDTRNPGTSIRQRQDFAGVLWYSFYERGGVIEDFLRHAVAYVRGVRHETLNTIKRPALAEEFLRQIKLKPYLFILDGLERILVAYNRLDAAQMADEEADHPHDVIAKRDPCSCIRPEDDEFLRQLTAAAPTKILISTRLTPSVLVNQARQPLPGVKRVPLAGLRPADAEALLCSQGVRGDSAAIQAYLRTNCDCHPLVVGVLAGLVSDYLPDRGNFNAWASDAGPLGGGRLNLGELDLRQRKTHILKAAIEALPPTSRALLSTLSLVSKAVEYAFLEQLNPHLPPMPEEVEEPTKPEEYSLWKYFNDERKAKLKADYPVALARFEEYQQAVKARLESSDFIAAPRRLAETVKDLERRGLLQYDANSRRYDLHPVVRGIAAGGLKPEETDRYGRSVVDYFQSRPHNPYEHTETMADIESGVQVVRTLIQMGHMQEAADALEAGLIWALQRNLEAFGVVLSLLRPFFPSGWGTIPIGIDETDGMSLAHSAGNALDALDHDEDGLDAYVAVLRGCLSSGEWHAACIALGSVGQVVEATHGLRQREVCTALANELAEATEDPVLTSHAKGEQVFLLTTLGQWHEAESVWKSIDRDKLNKSARTTEFGDILRWGVALHREMGTLQDPELIAAETQVRVERNHRGIRNLAMNRGCWHAERGEWALAADSFAIAVRMAREIGHTYPLVETWLALSKYHAHTLDDPKAEATRLSGFKHPSHYPLAELWLAIGDKTLAIKHALEAYKSAWKQGEPYVERYDLNKAIELLKRLGEPIPTLQPYDPAKHPPFPWEAEVRAAIERLKKKKAEKDAKGTKGDAS